MGKRSLKASAIGIAKAKHAFQRREWTQEYLASAVGLQTRQSIWKFFSGKPIERHLFVDICFQLDLDWEDIAERLQYDSPLMVDIEVEDVQSASTIDELVQEVRSHLNPIIQAQCGTLQTAIDLAQPLALEHVYTDVELLPCLTNQRWLEVTDLQPSAITDQPPLLTSAQTRIPALQAVAQQIRLLILGKPGAGKTTFLQHLALLCNAGNAFSHCVPAFVSLRDLAAKLNDNSFNFVQYISQQWSACQLSHEKILTLLQEGRVLLLLDGLDEVSGDIQTQLSSQIQTFADTYSKNPLIVTCRLAAQDYYFRGFTVMEMADFAPSQITTFVQKWFTSTNSANPEIGAAKAEQFLEQIQRPEHQSIRELAVTPILLHLACLVFQERSAFPKKRSRLYQTGLDILLVRWDKARGIQRDQTYHLSVSDRVNILSQIAATTFEQGKYFFEKAEIIPIIASYLGTLPDSDTDPETLWLNSEAVLQT
ncbi:MAG TPA: NACHT domain-containing protein, partial [Crinalium sp.]